MTFKHTMTKHRILSLLALTLLPLAGQAPAHASTETVVYNFAGPPTDGAQPQSGLTGDGTGAAYGTTASGGANLGSYGNGDGTVYKITPTGQETILYSFGATSTDGLDPDAGVTLGKDGDFYGTTRFGGVFGFGTVYKITPSGQETVLYSFMGGSNDGQYPDAGVIQAKDGSFYGTTSQGGAYSTGTVYKVTPDGQETVLYAFTGGSDGADPETALLQAKDGNFYGTTFNGGVDNHGTVYKITPSGTLTTVYAFAGGASDGADPDAAVIQARDGSLYGTTQDGGPASFMLLSSGAVYKISPNGQETVLHFFGSGTDGYVPQAALFQAKDGSFYGTTVSGGDYYRGTVYRITPTGQETVIHSFGNGPDGSNPYSSLVQDKFGSLYGTAYVGGAYGIGTIFRITL